MWVFYAVLSAVFAAATSILAKIGVRDIPSNLATAVRTGVVLVMAWIVVFVSGQQNGIGKINGSGMLFLPQNRSCFCSFRAWLRVRRGCSITVLSRWQTLRKLYRLTN